MANNKAKICELVEKSQAKYPFTAVLCNFMHGSNDFEIKTYEHKMSNARYHIGIVLWDTRSGKRSVTPLCTVNGAGSKNIAYEEAYKKIYAFLVKKYEFTQGCEDYDELMKDLCNHVQSDLNVAETIAENVDKKENVIVESEGPVIEQNTDSNCTTLAEYCSTEKIYDFTSGESAIMNRWFLMDNVQVNSNSTGMIKYWHITQDLLKSHSTSINLLPIHGFVYGSYELEFRMLAPANPFAAGLIMLSVYPYDYGVNTYTQALKGVYINSSVTTCDISSMCFFDVDVVSGYANRNNSYAAVTRPNVKLDLNQGGEVVLQFPFKYHKTMIRNFDNSFDKAVNEGILGSNFGRIELSVLSKLLTGEGQPKYIDIRLMFRIKKVCLTGMTSNDLISGVKVRHPKTSYYVHDMDKYLLELTSLNELMKQKPRDENAIRKIYEKMNQVQGPVLSAYSAVRTGVNVAKEVIDLTENTAKRVGFRTTNRDKPVDYLHVVKTVPRPRQNFNFGVGLDDAIKLTVNPEELTNFYERFADEPSNFKEYAQIPGFLNSFDWKTNDVAGAEIFRWPIDLQISPSSSQTAIDSNLLKAPVCIAASMFANFWGTLQLQFEMIKTSYHRGAIEIGIHFGKQVDNEQIRSCYVKVCDIQQNNGIVVTVPYIYDTVARHLTTTSLAGCVPNTVNPNVYKFYSKAHLVVRVINQLQAPTTVFDTINVVVWIKAGPDFSMNALVPCNTTLYDGYIGVVGSQVYPQELRKVLTSERKHEGFMMKSTGLSRTTKMHGMSVTQVTTGSILKVGNVNLGLKRTDNYPQDMQVVQSNFEGLQVYETYKQQLQTLCDTRFIILNVAGVALENNKTGISVQFVNHASKGYLAPVTMALDRVKFEIKEMLRNIFVFRDLHLLVKKVSGNLKWNWEMTIEIKDFSVVFDLREYNVPIEVEARITDVDYRIFDEVSNIFDAEAPPGLFYQGSSILYQSASFKVWSASYMWSQKSIVPEPRVENLIVARKIFEAFKPKNTTINQVRVVAFFIGDIEHMRWQVWYALRKFDNKETFLTPIGIDSVEGVQHYFNFQVVQGDMDDFNTGVYRNNVVTSVDHLDFKNILKMPVKVLRKVEYKVHIPNPNSDKLKEVDCFHSIPVAPLNHSLLQYFSNQSIFTNSLATRRQTQFYSVQHSPQYQINRMFGMFRGSVNFTFVFECEKNIPIYISYLPHDYTLRNFQAPLFETLLVQNSSGGAVYMPNYGVGNDDTTTIDPSVLGLNTTIVVPSVNMTERVQVPMTNPNNWLLMNRNILTTINQDTGWMVLSTMRESLEWFNGHLILWSAGSFKYDMFISCGDDIELGAFIGHPGVVNSYASTAFEDDFRRDPGNVVQSDFNIKGWTDTCIPQGSELVKFLKAKLGGLSYFDLGMIVLACVNNPLTDLARIGLVVTKLKPWLTLTENVQLVNETQVQKWIDLSNRAGQVVEGVLPAVPANDQNRGQTYAILQVILSVFPCLREVPGLTSKVWNICKELVHSVLSSNWMTLAFALYNILIEIGVITFDCMQIVVESMHKLFQCFMRESTQVASEEVWKLLMGVVDVLIVAISFVFRVQYTGDSLKYIVYEILVWGDRMPHQLNGMLTIVKRIMLAVKTIFDYFCSKSVEEVDILQQLAGKSIQLNEFIAESNLFLNAMNKKDLKQRYNRIKYLSLVFRAAKLKSLLVRHTELVKVAPLLNLCNEVLKKANEYQYLFKSDVVKKEPFVLCIQGKPNIGKSFLATAFAKQGIMDLGLQTETPDFVYTVSPGVEYWNGYEGQEVICYDDWCNLRDERTLTAHISQLYALKTSQPFNVPRAEIENKEQIATPHLVILTTNDAFPVSTIFSDNVAIYRRRDIVASFELDGYASINDVPKEVLKEGRHLKVHVFKDVTNKCSETITMSLLEFQEYFAERHKEHHEKEMENMTSRYNWLMEAVKKNSLDTIEIDNPFEVIQKANQSLCSVNPKLTSELIEAEVEKLMDLVNKHVLVSDTEMMIVRDEHGVVQGPNDDMFHVGKETYLYKAKIWFAETFADFIVSCKALLGDEKCRHQCSMCKCRYTQYRYLFQCSEDHFVCFNCANAGELACTFCPTHKSPLMIFVSVPVKTFLTLVKRKGKSFMKTFVDHFKKDTMEKFVAYTFLAQISALIVALLMSDVERDYNNAEMSEIAHQAYKSGFLSGLGKQFTDEHNTTQSEWELPHDDMIMEFTDNQELVSKLGDVREPCTNIQIYEVDGLSRKLIPYDFNVVLRAFEQAMRVSTRYTCPHSLLFLPNVIFRDAKFRVIFMGCEVELECNLCSNGCVLSDYRNVNVIVSSVMQETHVMREALRSCNYRVIAKSYPKFLWPSSIFLDIEKYKIDDLTKETWWEYLRGDTLVMYIKRVYPWVLTAGIIYAGGIVTHRVINLVMEMMNLGELVETRAGQVYKQKEGRRVKVLRRQRMRTQGAECVQNKVNVVLNNYVVLCCAGKKFLGLGISNSTMIVPKHMISLLEKFQRFDVDFFSVKHERTEFLFSNCSVSEISNKDVVLVNLNGKLYFKNIIKFFKPVQTAETSNISTNLIFYDGLADEREVDEIAVSLLGKISTNKAYSSFDKQNYISLDCFRYDYERSGACGSVIMDETQYPILGVHISGNIGMNEGTGVRIYREELETQSIQSNFEEAMEKFLCEDDCSYYGDECNIEYLGVVSRELVPFVPTETKIVPSKLDTLFESKSSVEPAILSAKDVRYTHEHSPMFYGVQKNGSPTLDFPIQIMLKAFTVLSSVIIHQKRVIRKPSVLSVEEAILGLPEVNVDDPFLDLEEEHVYYGPLPIQTSAGWPYSVLARNKDYGVTGTDKSGWIALTRDENLLAIKADLHEVLKKDLMEHKILRRKGNCVLNVFQDCLKDEKRKCEKVRSKGGTRLFSMSNVAGSISLRQYTLDFTSFTRFNRINNGIAVGINPDSMEWTYLATKLLEVSDNVFTTDFTNFGAGLNSAIVEMYGEMLIKYYSEHGEELCDEDKIEVRVLMRELSNSVHIVNNILYRTKCGSPSGAAITVEINSFAHLMYIYMVWNILGTVCMDLILGVEKSNLQYEYNDLKMYLRKQFNPCEIKQFGYCMHYDNFLANVFACVYGDDGIFSVSDNYREIFNAVTINLVLKEHGVGVTDASKSENIVKYTTLDKATFLKRRFGLHPFLNHIFMPLIEWSSIENCVRWVHKNLDPNVALMDNCETALELCFGYGPGVYEAFREDLNRKLKALGMPQIYKDWDDMHRRIFPDIVIT